MISSDQFRKSVLLNIFPSVDTPGKTSKNFDERGAALPCQVRRISFAQSAFAAPRAPKTSAPASAFRDSLA